MNLHDLIIMPLVTETECRAYLRALANSPWQYHLDDCPSTLEGPKGADLRSCADVLNLKRAACSRVLGEEGMWETYGEACGF